MKPSRGFLFVSASLFVVGVVSFLFIRRAFPPDEVLRSTQSIDRAINEKEAELKALFDRSPEEEARNVASRKTLSTIRATEDAPPPGVRIEITPKGKDVINESEGYRITLPLKLVLARSVESDHLEFHDPDVMCQGDPSCPPALRIDVAGENGAHLSLEDWFSASEAEADEPIYSPREPLVINGTPVMRVSVTLPEIFDGYDYYFAHNNKIYVLPVARTDHDAYQETIYSLTMLVP